MKPVPQAKAVAPLSGEYLEKRGLLKEALAKEEEVAQKIEGYKEVLLKYATDAKLPHSASLATIKSLSKLEEQRKLLNQLILEDNDGQSKSQPAHKINTQSAPSSSSSSSSSPSSSSSSNSNPTVSSASSSSRSHSSPNPNPNPPIASVGEPGQPLLVIIRHGKTEHNKLGLFTGWEVSKDRETFDIYMSQIMNITFSIINHNNNRMLPWLTKENRKRHMPDACFNNTVCSSTSCTRAGCPERSKPPGW